MRRFLLVAAMMMLPPWSAGIAAAQAEDAIEGAWVPVKAELAGQPFPNEILKTMSLKMENGKYTVQVGETVDKGTYKYDSKAKPSTVDITGVDGPNKGKTFLAIYELKGDTLQVCYDLQSKQRPKEFKTEKGTLQFLVSYKRQKP